ncbi:MAG TPA: serine hydrolase [Roseiflexaceae bacterium]|nr:serine hydrolase [Roseiflexaceae bacterium]
MTTQPRLSRGAPEAQGISSSAIGAFVDAVERQIHDMHSFMLLRHGHVVAEGWWAPYAPAHPHMLFSLSKSFTATAVGLAAAEGLLSLDDPVLAFFPDAAPAEVGEHLAAMRVRHLLSMSTGHAEDTTPALRADPDGDWARAFLACPVEHTPGTHFVYNSGATYMLSAIVQRRSGARLLEYLRPRLLEPLGIAEATWERCPRGVDTGGWGLSVTTESIACFGQLYLQGGVWHGRRLLPAGWAEEATARHVSNGASPESDWEQGYGYQFWRCRHGAYRGDGAFGQFCVVMPAQDAVLAITSGLGDMQAVLDLVWEHLLPAMGDAPLPEDRAAHEALRRQLARLALPTQAGRPSSPTARRVSGTPFAFASNDLGLEALTFDFAGEGCALTVRDGRGEHQLRCGFGAWAAGETTLDSSGPRPVAASGAWTGENSYAIRLCFYETPFCPTLTCRFEEGELRLTFQANVSFGPPRRLELVGRVG